MRYLLTLFLCGGCDFGDKSPADGDEASKEVSLPAFAVEPFAYVGVELSAKALSVAPTNCEMQLAKMNEASEKVQLKVGELPADNPEFARSLAAYSYALGLFYDCNLRQQAIDDGIEEIANDDQKIHYRASRLTDSTRFVEWFEYKNDEGIVSETAGEADQITGKMINLFSPEDELKTQTRIELTKKDNIRQITTLFWLEKNNGNEVVLKSHVVEYHKGETKEQLLSLRYHDTEFSESRWVLAHMKASGSMLLTNSCLAGDDYNSSCDDSSAADNIYHLDSNHQQRDPDDTFKDSREDFLVNASAKWSYGNYSADDLNPRTAFFAGTGDTATRRQTAMAEGLSE